MAKRYFMDTYYINGEVFRDEYTETEAREVLRNHDVLTWANTEVINAHGVIKYVRYVEDSETIGEKGMSIIEKLKEVDNAALKEEMNLWQVHLCLSAIIKEVEHERNRRILDTIDPDEWCPEN